ncbi:hypothetical protein [Microtetraspora malaysiensis]|uniref:hypothetical protein n=1 Tax=Microtetraspora malaysiensis TaxID=161358 RepID=UPI00082DB38C|nr:hypothetical protein [Microtetraspora malaysiensis]
MRTFQRIAARAIAAAALALPALTLIGSPAVADPAEETFTPHVTTLESNTSACPGNDQYFSGWDTQQPIEWTYTNGEHVCIEVEYKVAFTTANCAYQFYVPNRQATGYIDFWVSGLSANSNMRWGINRGINEYDKEGWYTIHSGTGVTSIKFWDKGPKGYTLGWGKYASLKRVCS